MGVVFYCYERVDERRARHACAPIASAGNFELNETDLPAGLPART